jgi:redox-sensitive bicupin YhaK (pirin superfamily)
MDPRYQEIPGAKLPEAHSPDGKAHVRVIAGEALGAKAVIETRTPIAYHDWTLEPGASVEVPLPPAFAAYVYLFEGAAEVDGQQVKEGQFAVLGEGQAVRLAVAAGAEQTARLLLLAGAPLREPVVQYGPFVMNTEQQIHEAIRDYQTGRMGQITREAR